MERKYDLLFIGPQATGKSCILASLMKRPIDPDPSQTRVSECVRGVLFNRTRLCEVGGYRELDSERNECIRKGSHICFVFDGPKLLNEVHSWQQGGVTTSFLTHWYKKILAIKKSQDIGRIWFIATHNDKYIGQNMHDDIIQSIESANQEYRKVAGTASKRYAFHDAMNGALFAINALNAEEVNTVYDKITQSR